MEEPTVPTTDTPVTATETATAPKMPYAMQLDILGETRPLWVGLAKKADAGEAKATQTIEQYLEKAAQA